jgi:Domain of unknown function (DUF4280)
MAEFLTTGALLQCSMGVAPSAFVADQLPGAPSEMGMTVATIVQFVAMKNIMPFGMCNSLANPTVASATAAAMGALTPMPCVPQCVAPWAPPAVAASYEGIPLATANSVCTCAYGGMVKVSTPFPGTGQAT